MAKMKAAIKTLGDHKRKIVINISTNGIKILDEKDEVGNLHLYWNWNIINYNDNNNSNNNKNNNNYNNNNKENIYNMLNGCTILVAN